mmetsp:Transcript_51622/g.85785  ORF Transcript_51622/g.85785 Transcript_51622/m.85785 type:complete len:214 (+) Transcript_51622:271-912(+)
MIFGDSVLRLYHQPSGLTFVFEAFDALKKIARDHESAIRCGAASLWSQRRGPSVSDNPLGPYDWTYTTTYRGKVSKADGGEVMGSPTEARIDIERLKGQDPIRFYTDMVLYEDELHDNGISVLSVKMRVMPKYVLVLLRFFLRVDGVIIRVHDTRLFHEFGSRVVLREYRRKEESFSTLVSKLPPEQTCYSDPGTLVDLLPVVEEICESFNVD